MKSSDTEHKQSKVAVHMLNIRGVDNSLKTMLINCGLEQGMASSKMLTLEKLFGQIIRGSQSGLMHSIGATCDSLELSCVLKMTLKLTVDDYCLKF